LHAFKDVQRNVRVGAAFHVHFDGAAEGGRAGSDLAGHRAAQIFINVQAKLAQFNGDVAVEILGVQFFHHLDVAGADFARRRFAGDVFSQMIQTDVAALGAKFLAGGKRFREGFAGDEAAREPIFHAVTRDAIRHAAFCGQPEDKIANQHESSRREADRG